MNIFKKRTKVEKGDFDEEVWKVLYLNLYLRDVVFKEYEPFDLEYEQKLHNRADKIYFAGDNIRGQMIFIASALASNREITELIVKKHLHANPKVEQMKGATFRLLGKKYPESIYTDIVNEIARLNTNNFNYWLSLLDNETLENILIGLKGAISQYQLKDYPSMESFIDIIEAMIFAKGVSMVGTKRFERGIDRQLSPSDASDFELFLKSKEERRYTDDELTYAINRAYVDLLMNEVAPSKEPIKMLLSKADRTTLKKYYGDACAQVYRCISTPDKSNLLLFYDFSGELDETLPRVKEVVRKHKSRGVKDMKIGLQYFDKGLIAKAVDAVHDTAYHAVMPFLKGMNNDTIGDLLEQMLIDLRFRISEEDTACMDFKKMSSFNYHAFRIAVTQSVYEYFCGMYLARDNDSEMNE